MELISSRYYSKNSEAIIVPNFQLNSFFYLLMSFKMEFELFSLRKKCVTTLYNATSWVATVNEKN